jgi:hypothetical protein
MGKGTCKIQVKLVLCLMSKHYAMKTNGGVKVYHHHS